jgi:hypothetical protein
VDTIFGVVIAVLVSGGLGVIAGRWLYRPSAPEDMGVDPVIDGERKDRTPHTHLWNTMYADGKGWRCGICNKVKGLG